MGYDFDWVVAFSDAPFSGNGALVVHGAEPLDHATRLQIVRETSLVECTFLEPSAVADIRFRIYLADREVPFAGHPTLAGVGSMVARGLAKPGPLTVETAAGLIEIEIAEDGQIAMTQIAPRFGPRVDPPRVADVLGLDAGDIIGTPQVVSTGLPFVVTQIRNRTCVDAARLNVPAARALADDLGGDVMEPYLITTSGVPEGADTYGRLLLVPPQPPEDPFTGSATGAAASYLWAEGALSSPTYVAAQGDGMGRPSRGRVAVLTKAGDITGVRLSGRTHVTMSGTLNL